MIFSYFWLNIEINILIAAPNSPTPDDSAIYFPLPGRGLAARNGPVSG
jgi:hypothetical protein